MMYRIIQEEEELSKKEWESLVKGHPQGNIFQTPEMCEVFKNTKNYEPLFVALADNSGEIVALLLSVVQREFGGPLGMLSSRCVTWGGPLIKESLDKKSRDIVLKTILREQNRIARKKAIYMEFRNLWDTGKYRTSFEDSGYVYEDHLDILIDLTKTEEELWKQMKKNRRKSVNRSKKSGLGFFELEFGDRGFMAHFELIKHTYERVKIPLADMSLFKSAGNILQPKGMAHFFYIKKNEKILASRIVLTYKNLVYDWYAGSNKEGDKEHANEYLVWNILLWAKNKGYQIFDFGGAGKPDEPYGPREFKIRFGGAVVNYGRYQNVFKKASMKIAKIGLDVMKKVK